MRWRVFFRGGRQRDLPHLALYWAVQLSAWSLLVFVLALSLWLSNGYTPGRGYGLALGLLIGLVASHTLRAVIRARGWGSAPMAHSLPRMVLAALVISTVAALFQAVLHDLLFPGSGDFLTARAIFENVINWGILLIVWGVCWFAYQWFMRVRREEVRNLRLEAANRDDQLATLRAQLNPHFMFNALNGIRALIDEDPVRAKQAITQLSSILRNAMGTVKRRTVPLGEELDVVKDYLALERMRFEERLQVTFRIEEGIERAPVPPMLLQTLVENAVRHGIAKRKEGGEVIIDARRSGSGLTLGVRNTGTYVPGQVHGSGIGLSGTRKRLEMIYGPSAGITIGNHNNMVLTEVNIPWMRMDEQ
ncbi:MAG TPA: histidine kinase [Flavobacteriales bacterium]|nr:histidine kinase [Flavobacteriales bacterium]